MKTLVTGGARSGKSVHAEALLATAGQVAYVAPGPTADARADPEWAARVAAHAARRPAHWSTVETHDVATAITAAPDAVLVDCLGTWITSLIDDLGGWDQPEEDWMPALRDRVDLAAQAVELHPADVVLVTNEVGMGLVPEYRSGRVFRDLLGWANQRIGAACDEVHLAVAGRILVL